jgi:mannose-6-phosphate isomerase-like protein (cupin superfamily)
MMKRNHLRFGKGFRIAIGNRRSQAAEMVIAPGDGEGGPDNRHRGADQWLFVVSGTGRATVNGKRYGLRAGSLVLIERGDTHEIRNSGRRPLRTLNFYVPPAYTTGGDPLPRGRR